MDLLLRASKFVPDVGTKIVLKSAVGFAMTPEEKGKINSQAILEIGMPAADTAGKFAALLRDNVPRLPQELRDPVLLELGFHILKMPENEQAGAVQAFVAAGDAHPIKNEFLSLLVDVAREGGVDQIAYQAIDTLGKDAIRNGESAASIANRLGVTSHEWLLTQLVEQHAAGNMVD